jgi:hypothetical protein
MVHAKKPRAIARGFFVEQQLGSVFCNDRTAKAVVDAHRESGHRKQSSANDYETMHSHDALLTGIFGQTRLRLVGQNRSSRRVQPQVEFWADLLRKCVKRRVPDRVDAQMRLEPGKSRL